MNQPANEDNSEPKIKRSARRRSSKHHPTQQLTVLSLGENGMVECQLQTKTKTVTFQFNVQDMEPTDIVNSLVGRLMTLSTFNWQEFAQGFRIKLYKVNTCYMGLLIHVRSSLNLFKNIRICKIISPILFHKDKYVYLPNN